MDHAAPEHEDETFDPAATEAALSAEPETAKQVDEFLANPETGEVRTRPS
jgi:hypothetical protein